jgi:hypothetical protein
MSRSYAAEVLGTRVHVAPRGEREDQHAIVGEASPNLVQLAHP